ncbi:hypothetical protein MRB53_027803 [Persea americana]|uniref:Uncharacterized protein n=1 Tax=Persea americana TaxID=3435 RepID=A0ACC2KE88_PERAE|nr:hypothetical protein MRB53_027803 [Persea americana]
MPANTGKRFAKGTAWKLESIRQGHKNEYDVARSLPQFSLSFCGCRLQSASVLRQNARCNSSNQIPWKHS